MADTSTEIEDEFLNNDDPTVAAPDILDNAGGNDDIPEIPDVDSDEDSDFEEDEDEDPNKLWCICQQPHNNRFMICCDSCSGLYFFLANFDNFWPSLRNLVFLTLFSHFQNICQQPHNNWFMICCDSCSGF